MVLMSFADIVILVIVITIVGLLSYNLFIKREKTCCSGCSKLRSMNRKRKGLAKFFKKQKEMGGF